MSDLAGDAGPLETRVNRVRTRWWQARLVEGVLLALTLAAAGAAGHASGAWFDVLAFGPSLALGAVLLATTVRATREVAGFELIVAGLLLAALVAALLAPDAMDGPSLFVLPTLYAALVLLAFGLAVLGIRHAGPASVAQRLIQRVFFAVLLLCLGGILHWSAVASGRAGRAAFDLLADGLLLVLLGAGWVAVVAHGATSVRRSAVLLASMLAAGLAALLTGGTLYTAALQVAASGLLALALALPVQALRQLALGRWDGAAAAVFTDAVTVLVGREVAVDLWLALRFGERIGLATLALQVLLPALVGAAALLPGEGWRVALFRWPATAER